MCCSSSKLGRKLVCCWEKQCMPQRYIQSSDVTPELHEPSIHKTLNFCGEKKSPLGCNEDHSPWSLRLTGNSSNNVCDLLTRRHGPFSVTALIARWLQSNDPASACWRAAWILQYEAFTWELGWPLVIQTVRSTQESWLLMKTPWNWHWTDKTLCVSWDYPSVCTLTV